MLVLISHLLNQSVIAFDAAEVIGVLKDPIIDPTNGKVAGYFLGHGLFFLKQSIISVEDIVGYDENRIVVQSGEAIRNSNDEPKIRQILQKKISVFTAKVYTESGRYLGQANDLLLDTELSMIVKYYVHGLMQDRIISAEHVISIEKRGIIVEDKTSVSAAVGVEAEPS